MASWDAVNPLPRHLRISGEQLSSFPMSSRQAVIAAVLWAILLGPAACLGGVLDHACPSCPETSCGHEDECVSDPCNTLLVPVSAMRSVEDGAHEAPTSLDLPEWQETDLSAPAATLHGRARCGLPLRLTSAKGVQPLRC
jgi:hypothetical protein